MLMLEKSSTRLIYPAAYTSSSSTLFHLRISMKMSLVEDFTSHSRP